MKRANATILLGLLATGLGVAAGGKPMARPGGFSELHRVDVGGASDLEVVMGLIRRNAGSVGAKHYHPGGEFGFILEGSVTVETESEPLLTLKTGDSFYQPPGEWHVVGTDAEGAQTLVFRVLEKGQAMVVAVDQATIRRPAVCQ